MDATTALSQAGSAKLKSLSNANSSNIDKAKLKEQMSKATDKEFSNKESL